jgi:TFIIF-interacting CTD phosphatase-like protein
MAKKIEKKNALCKE